jgi:hypothetical protein
MDRACAAACHAVRVHILQLRGRERRLERRRPRGRLTITAEQAAGRVRPPAGVHQRRRPRREVRAQRQRAMPPARARAGALGQASAPAEAAGALVPLLYARVVVVRERGLRIQVRRGRGGQEIVGGVWRRSR